MTNLFNSVIDFDPFDFSISTPFNNNYNNNHIDNGEKDLFPIEQTSKEIRISSKITEKNCSKSVSPQMICAVCGDQAFGYNFNQITCAACKTFFRRNAHRQTANWKCRSFGSCVITITNRRQCSLCRLKKCFDIDMKKDWIRTDEERQIRQLIKEKQFNDDDDDGDDQARRKALVQRKKRRLAIFYSNSNVSSPMLPISNLRRNVRSALKEIDWSLLNEIFNNYNSYGRQANLNHINRYDQSTSLVDFLNDECCVYTALIQFFKQIPQFNRLNENEKLFLIKSNLQRLVLLHCLLIENFTEHPRIGSFITKWVNEDFHRNVSQTGRALHCFIEYPLVIQVFLIIIVFSLYLSIPHWKSSSASPSFINRFNIYSIQNTYINLFWKYLNHLFGEKESIRSFDLMVSRILRYQVLMNTLDNLVQQYHTNDQLNQLIKSLIGLT